MRKIYSKPASVTVVLQSKCICTLIGSLDKSRTVSKSFDEGVEGDVKASAADASLWDNEW